MGAANRDGSVSVSDLVATGSFTVDTNERLVVGGARPVTFMTSGGYLASTDIFTTRSLVGIDYVSDLGLVAGSTSLFQQTGFAATTTVSSLSSDKTQPAGVTANSCRGLRRFKGNYYLIAIEAATTYGAIWKAAPASGNTAFSWSRVLQGSTGSGVIGTGFQAITTDGAVPNDTNDLALFYAEYSDPTTGPTLWRTTDGTTWTAVLGPAIGSPNTAGIRHFHAIKQDPYNPSTLYMTAGDGITKPIWKSSDFGLTWSVIVTDSNFQGVQISFSPAYVWFAGDSTRGTVFQMSRATNACYWLPGNHRYVAAPCSFPRTGGHSFGDGVATNGSKTFTSATAGFGTTFDINDVGRQVILPSAYPPNTYITGVASATSVQVSNAASATPGASRFVLGTDEFYYTAFYGVVDPLTGIFYSTANDNSGGGNRSGMFAHTGQSLILLDEYEASFTGVNQVSAEHFIYGGRVYHAGKSRPLLSADYTQAAP